jgi:hypothetical protein
VTNNDLTREAWIQAVGRRLCRTGPDMYPEGYFYWLAEEYAKDGGYDHYVNGDYAPGVLWSPSV